MASIIDTVTWLRRELESWVADGTIDRATAERIGARYATPTPSLPWSVLLFAGLGAAILGCGIILVMAYNWEAIPRLAKLGILGGSTLAAHAAGLELRRRSPRNTQLSEGVSLLGSMLFGASIWLVAQAYHLDEHYPDAFLFWGLGAAAVGLALPSVAHGWLCATAFTIWGMSESADFGEVAYGAPLLLAGSLGAIVWMTRSRSLPIAIALALGLLLPSGAAALPGNAGWMLMIHYGSLLIGIASFMRQHERWRGAALALSVLGGLLSLGTLYLLSFADIGEEAIPLRCGQEPDSVITILYLYGTLASAFAAWLFAAKRPGLRALALEGRLAVFLIGLVAHGLTVHIHDERDVRILTVSILVMLLGLAIHWMLRGCRSGEAGMTIEGSLLLVAVGVASFFELFESLVFRGLAFVSVGVVLFAVGWAFTRSTRERVGPELQP